MYRALSYRPLWLIAIQYIYLVHIHVHIEGRSHALSAASLSFISRLFIFDYAECKSWGFFPRVSFLALFGLISRFFLPCSIYTMVLSTEINWKIRIVSAHFKTIGLSFKWPTSEWDLNNIHNFQLRTTVFRISSFHRKQRVLETIKLYKQIFIHSIDGIHIFTYPFIDIWHIWEARRNDAVFPPVCGVWFRFSFIYIHTYESKSKKRANYSQNWQMIHMPRHFLASSSFANKENSKLKIRT